MLRFSLIPVGERWIIPTEVWIKTTRRLRSVTRTARKCRRSRSTTVIPSLSSMLSPLEGKVVMWWLKRRGVLHSAWGLKVAKSRRSKVARAITAATYLEQGKIWFPRKPWRDEWDTELVTFPHSRHDDQVDVLAYAALQINT